MSDFVEAFIYLTNLVKFERIAKGQEQAIFTSKIPADKYDTEAQLVVKDGIVHPTYFVYTEKSQ